MSKTNNDIYRSCLPYAFCYIGDVLVPVISFDTSKVCKYDEASTCHAKIDLEVIDTSILTDKSVTNDIVEIQIWAGYLTDTENIEKQLTELKFAIEHNQSQNKFTKRFDGYVSQPEFCHGMERMLELDCLDWVGFLKEYNYYFDFKDANTECRNVFEVIKKDLKGLNIILDPYSGSKRLGELDGTGKNYVYHSSGKSYWDILQDIAKRTGNRIIVDGKDIHITQYKKEPFIWQLYYGSSENQKIEGIQQGQYFESAKIRFGQKFRVDKSNVVVDVFGENHTKKGKERKVQVRYPENADIIPGITMYKKYRIPGDIRIEGAKILAENKYKELSTRLMTASIEFPYANNFMNPWDIIEFNPEKGQQDMNYLKDVWFSINSISESYSQDAYRQTVEADSDPTLGKTVKKKIAPGKINSNNLIYGPTNSQLGINRRK